LSVFAAAASPADAFLGGTFRETAVLGVQSGGKSIAQSFAAEESMNDADLSRRQALYELLAIPDPPDIHRGHVLRFQGKPGRHRLLPQLAAAFVQAKLLEIRERAPLDEIGRTA
jgi:hypothetical protein